MRYSSHFFTFLIFTGIFLSSCNNRTNQEPLGDTEMQKDFKFEGISIFKKNLTLREIKNELDNKKIKYYNVQSDNNGLYAFSVPFDCCSEKEIIYLPFYNIGDLSLIDLFVIFDDDRLAKIWCEINESGIYANVSGREFKKFFNTKYGTGKITSSDSNNYETIVQLNEETFINYTDTISMTFKTVTMIDSVWVWDTKCPINVRLDRTNEDREAFRKTIQKIIPKKEIIPKKSKSKQLTGYKPAGRNSCWINPGKYGVSTTFHSFEMIFPNKLQECCTNKEDSLKKAEEIRRKKFEEGVLKEL